MAYDEREVLRLFREDMKLTNYGARTAHVMPFKNQGDLLRRVVWRLRKWGYKTKDIAPMVGVTVQKIWNLTGRNIT